MSESNIHMRFVAGTGFESWAILKRANIAMPFTPSHVEGVVDGGYIGARFSGGVKWRPVGYDTGHFSHELILDIPSSPEQGKLYEDFLRSHVGWKYDWKSIFDFALPENWHTYQHIICSALQTLALRKATVFQWPVARPAHLTSPTDLLFGLSCIMEVPGI